MIGREDRVFGRFRGYGKEKDRFLLKKIKTGSPFYVPLKDEVPFLFTTMRKDSNIEAP